MLKSICAEIIAEAHYTRAMLEIILSQYSPAEQDLEACLKISPKHGEALRTRVLLAFSEGDVSKGAALYYSQLIDTLHRDALVEAALTQQAQAIVSGKPQTTGDLRTIVPQIVQPEDILGAFVKFAGERLAATK